MKLMVIDGNPLEGQTYDHLISHKLKDTYPEVRYVGQAYTSTQGLELAGKLSPNVIILDTDLPGGMDAYTLLQALHEIVPHAAIVVVTLTESLEFLQNAFRYNVFDFYLKPMVLEELTGLLNKLKDSVASRSNPPKADAHHNKYYQLVQLVQSPRNVDTQAALDAFWEMVDMEGQSDMVSIRLHCIELATSILLFPAGRKNQPAALSVSYNRFIKQICSCEQTSEIHECLNTFVHDCSRTLNQYMQDTGSEQIAKAKRLIDRYIQQEKSVTLESIAHEVYISPYYLSRMFKKIEGINFVEYLLNCRLERAKLLLSTTNETIVTIALRCGYNETNSFRRLFKKMTGVSPMEYRKSNEHLMSQLE